jgi:hypothetical protein
MFHSVLILQISSPVYCEGKSREMILVGTTADKMRGIYTRPHRNSIYQPATIHDIPFEVLRESFLYLLKKRGSDLVAASLACRAWRVVALDVMNSRKRFREEGERFERVICGLHLRSIVGLECYTIKQLVLDLKLVGKGFIPFIAGVVSPTLSSLLIGCDGVDSSECYEVLNLFFERCDGIRNLCLEDFDFGDDPTAFSQTAKDGFSRLIQFNLLDCRGDIRMFVENTSIPNLQILGYWSEREAVEEEEIVSSIVSSYRTLCSTKIVAKFESSASLLKVVESCRDLESLAFGNLGGGLILERFDILAFASLPRLKSLKIYGCEMAGDAGPSLSRCRGLKEIRIENLVDVTVLLSRRDLARLRLDNPSKEVVDGIVENCPNLNYLVLEEVELEEEDLAELKQSLMFKTLAKLKVNEESVRLGTDWEGY